MPINISLKVDVQTFIRYDVNRYLYSGRNSEQYVEHIQMESTEAGHTPFAVRFHTPQLGKVLFQNEAVGIRFYQGFYQDQVVLIATAIGSDARSFIQEEAHQILSVNQQGEHHWHAAAAFKSMLVIPPGGNPDPETHLHFNGLTNCVFTKEEIEPLFWADTLELALANITIPGERPLPSMVVYPVDEPEQTSYVKASMLPCPPHCAGSEYDDLAFS